MTVKSFLVVVVGFTIGVFICAHCFSELCGVSKSTLFYNITSPFITLFTAWLLYLTLKAQKKENFDARSNFNFNEIFKRINELENSVIEFNYINGEKHEYGAQAFHEVLKKSKEYQGNNTEVGNNNSKDLNKGSIGLQKNIKKLEDLLEAYEQLKGELRNDHSELIKKNIEIAFKDNFEAAFDEIGELKFCDVVDDRICKRLQDIKTKVNKINNRWAVVLRPQKTEPTK